MHLTRFAALSLLLSVGPVTTPAERAMAQGVSTPPAAHGAAPRTAQAAPSPTAQGASASPDQAEPAQPPAASKRAPPRFVRKRHRTWRGYAGRRVTRAAAYGALPPGYCLPPPYYYQFHNYGGPLFGPCWWVWGSVY